MVQEFFDNAAIRSRNFYPRGMAEWRESLFATMARNARTAADYYNIPANCVVELGTKIAI